MCGGNFIWRKRTTLGPSDPPPRKRKNRIHIARIGEGVAVFSKNFAEQHKQIPRRKRECELGGRRLAGIRKKKKQKAITTRGS